MKLLTASLEGKALDWALAVALEKTPALSFERKVVVSDIMGWQPFDYTNSHLCLNLIKRYGLEHKWPVAPNVTNGSVLVWAGKGGISSQSARGQTLEQAVARCVVQMRLGDGVEVPDELCGEQA